MTDKIFSMPVRVNDFIANTVNLNNEELGVYWRLLCFAWENKAMLCNDKSEIYEICKSGNGKSKRVVDKILKKFFVLNDENCYVQKAQQDEWERVTNLHEIRSIAGKKGAEATNLIQQTDGKGVGKKPPLTLTLTPTLINNKILYSEEFEKFWTNDGRSIKSDTYKQWKKLGKEEKDDLKKKWELYKEQNTNDKGKFFKACERFLAKRIFDEISVVDKVVNFDPLARIKNYVSFVKKCQRIPNISDDMVDIMLREGLITKKEHARW